MNWLSNIFGGLGKAAAGAGKSLWGAGQSIINPVSGALGAGMKAGQNLMSGFGGKTNPASFIEGIFGGGKSQPPAVSQMMPSSGYNQLTKNQLLNSPYKPNVSNIIPGFDSMTSASSPNEKPKSNSWLSQLFPGGTASGIAGLAIPAIGNMFAPEVKELPEFNSLSSVQAMQNFRPGNSMSPEYRTMLQHETDRMKDQKVKELQALYRNARPGTDYLTDTNYQSDLSRINRETEEVMADNLARAEGQFSQQEQERLSQLANLDIYSIMAQTGLSAQEADNFKQMFSDVGNMFLTNATRQPETDLMSLFGGR